MLLLLFLLLWTIGDASKDDGSSGADSNEVSSIAGVPREGLSGCFPAGQLSRLLLKMERRGSHASSAN